ncbi:hypothetical protein E2C01_050852 [Portunus trituberculatus]|uniref:Uncharacterized protein n=1 Tax=Portunus trituberculatus TaxID=210409 RepID=A0A5B7GH32_PORTR|nr:hypothetical protein [Portunus trituberculatus]
MSKVLCEAPNCEHHSIHISVVTHPRRPGSVHREDQWDTGTQHTPLAGPGPERQLAKTHWVASSLKSQLSYTKFRDKCFEIFLLKEVKS